MSSRISSAVAVLSLLAGCSAAESPPPPGEVFDCAIGPGAAPTALCTLERAGDDLVLHHPDGSFRRLARDPASGTLVPRDGAERLVPEQEEADVVAFSIGVDRYRIPRALLDPTAP